MPDTAYQRTLKVLDEGVFACCIPGIRDGQPYVLVPELQLSTEAMRRAVHHDERVRVGFAIGATIGLGRYVRATSDDFAPYA